MKKINNSQRNLQRNVNNIKTKISLYDLIQCF